MSSPIYRHYGNDEFINRKYNITNNCGKKPRGGLWASPKGCDLPWRTWCIGENFHTERLKRHFDFKLRRNTKILKIRSVNDIIPYLIKGNSWNEDSEERMRLVKPHTTEVVRFLLL